MKNAKLFLAELISELETPKHDGRTCTNDIMWNLLFAIQGAINESVQLNDSQQQFVRQATGVVNTLDENDEVENAIVHYRLIVNMALPIATYINTCR